MVLRFRSSLTERPSTETADADYLLHRRRQHSVARQEIEGKHTLLDVNDTLTNMPAGAGFRNIYPQVVIPPGVFQYSPPTMLEFKVVGLTVSATPNLRWLVGGASLGSRASAAGLWEAKLTLVCTQVGVYFQFEQLEHATLARLWNVTRGAITPYLVGSSVDFQSDAAAGAGVLQTQLFTIEQKRREF